jgi:drug/metabolite transporter (DMT)-like permease
MMLYVKLVISMIIWGGTWVSGRVVAAEIHPVSAAFLRFAVASAFLLVMAMRVERRWPRLALRDAGWAAVLGATGVFAYNILFFTGLKTVQAGRASLIIAATPAVVALLSRVLLREPLAWSRAVGIPVSLAGVAVLLSRGDVSSLLSGGVSPGDLAIFGCVAAWSAYTLAGKQAMARMSPVSAVTWSCLLGDAMLLPPALADGVLAQAAGASLLIWANLLFLGVMATGLAFIWYYQGIRAIGAARAGIFINLVPVAAVAMGLAILGEEVGLSMLLGGAMVLAGVFLTNRPGRPGSLARPTER